MGGAAPFMAAVRSRPMMDVVQTTASPAALHQLAIMVLTTGPVGIGDALGKTNATLLSYALRNDSVILKPAYPAMRLDSWYPDNSPDKGEVWAAVAGPARAVYAEAGGKNHRHQLLPPWSARHDRRANSMVRLPTGRSGAAADDELWWHSLLATNVGPTGRGVGTADLYPPPSVGSTFAVVEFGVGCSNSTRTGAAANTCITMIGPGATLAVQTSDAAAPDARPSTPPRVVHGSGDRKFRLFNWAPVLPGGFALIGEQSKFVHVSPQRFVAGKAAEKGDACIHAANNGGKVPAHRCLPNAADSIHPSEMMSNGAGAGGVSMTFAVVGSPREVVNTTIMLPGVASGGGGRSTEPRLTEASPRASAIVVVLPIVIGESGVVKVTCTAMECTSTCS